MSRAIKAAMTKIFSSKGKNKLDKLFAHPVREELPNHGFKKVKAFDIDTQKKLPGTQESYEGVKMTLEEKKEFQAKIEEESQAESDSTRDLIQQEKFYNDNLTTRVKSQFYDEPIPEMVTLMGANKERARGIITGYQMQHKVDSGVVDDHLIESIEKVHYALIHDTPVRKKYVLRVLPDFTMKLNKPLDQINMGEPIFKKTYDKMQKEQDEKKSYNKKFFKGR
ncbi:unnamed protein product [Moneuplotes crassus]|uniref:Uncharacterized protein n=1 Tax=Euplotes crassus TaxID=5936 RepID=A0AAD2D1B3_EUPCR|nr:unnamed protein product [Moneuplotes crassus]